MKETVMKSRYSLGWTLMLIAMALSFVPAATALVQPVAALSACDWAQFVADVTVPDGTTFAPNTAFTKTWRLKNIGTCTWTTSYALVFDTGDRMGGPASVNLSNTVYPGQTVDLSISLTAPAAAGHYIGYWKFKNAAGVLFGIGSTMNKSWWVEINVSGSSPGVAYDFAANYCSATWYSLQYSLPCPGTDGDSRGFVLKVDRPQLEDGTYDTGSGLITNPQNAYNGDIHGAFPAFRVQSGDKFRATVNCAYGATSCFVTFRLDYQIGNGPINTLWSFREKYEGLYFRTNVDLSSLAGQDVKFILTVLATGSAVGDRALWSNPAIVRPGGGPPPPPPPPSGNKFDFGTAASPVAAGYTRVTETTAFSSGGYGWTDTSSLESRDRGAPADDLLRDFVMSTTAARTFKLTIPNGSYAVTVTMGDHDYAHDNMVVKANGTTMLADVDSAVGAFTVRTFNVTVTGGTLALEFSDAGGNDPTWIVNALTVSSSSPPPAGCDRAQFIADVTVPDGTVFLPGASFSKTWRLKNVGTCTWTTSYLLVFDTGDKMGGPDAMNLPNIVTPGQTVDLTVNLTAPVSAGSYRGYWKFQNANGVRFGIGADGTKSWWVDIRVAGPTPTPGTPGPSPTPGTGTMYDFAANACSAVWSSDAGRLPCPGTDGDQRGFVLKVSNPQLENGTVDPRLGLLTYPQNIWNGYILGIFPPYHVKTGDRFRSIVNCAYGATSCYVIFRLDYQTGTGPITTYWAFIEKYEGQYYQADLDLSPLVGQDIKFILHVLSAGSPTGDRALWVAPIIYNPASIVTAGAPITATATPTAPTPTATTTLQAPTPTATTTLQAPTPTATGTSTSGWNNYQNVKYGFSFAFPPGSSIASQSDNAGRVYLPFAPATNLAQKYVDVSVVEGAATCKSPQTNPQASSENVTINGIQFLKETGSEGAAGNIYDWTGYSTTKGTACISLTFVLHSTNPGVYPTPPPLFDKAAESAVFSSIMATYASQ
jgi:hypothetical protein